MCLCLNALTKPLLAYVRLALRLVHFRCLSVCVAVVTRRRRRPASKQTNLQLYDDDNVQLNSCPGILHLFNLLQSSFLTVMHL